MRRKEILFPELSYANADHTRLKRWFIRSVEGLSGRDRYAALYDIWRRDIAPTGERIFGRMLELIDVSVRDAGPMAAGRPARHAAGDRRQPSVRHRRRHRVLSLAEQLGRPFRVMINAELLKIEEMKPYSLPIDFPGDQGSAEEQSRRPPRGGAAAEGRRHHRDLPGRRRRHRAEGLRQGAGSAVEDVSGAPRAGSQGVGHPDPFLRPERPAVPPRQRADEHGRATRTG